MRSRALGSAAPWAWEPGLAPLQANGRRPFTPGARGSNQSHGPTVSDDFDDQWLDEHDADLERALFSWRPYPLSSAPRPASRGARYLSWLRQLARLG